MVFTQMQVLYHIHLFATLEASHFDLITTILIAIVLTSGVSLMIN